MLSELEQQLWNILKDLYKCATDTMPYSEPMVDLRVPVRVLHKIRILVPEKNNLIENTTKRSGL